MFMLRHAMIYTASSIDHKPILQRRSSLLTISSQYQAEKIFFPHNIAKFFSPNMLTLTKPDHDHGVSNTYEYAKQSLPGQSDKWNIHASDEHTYSNKSSMPHRQSMIFTQICSGTLMGQNKSTRANRPEK